MTGAGAWLAVKSLERSSLDSLALGPAQSADSSPLSSNSPGAETPPFSAGRSAVLVWSPLALNVLAKYRDRRATARSGEVTRRPQATAPITSANIRPFLSQPSGRNTFERINQTCHREERRMEAARLLGQGVSQSEVA